MFELCPAACRPRSFATSPWSGCCSCFPLPPCLSHLFSLLGIHGLACSARPGTLTFPEGHLRATGTPLLSFRAPGLSQAPAVRALTPRGQPRPFLGAEGRSSGAGLHPPGCEGGSELRARKPSPWGGGFGLGEARAQGLCMLASGGAARGWQRGHRVPAPFPGAGVGGWKGPRGTAPGHGCPCLWMRRCRSVCVTCPSL